MIIRLEQHEFLKGEIVCFENISTLHMLCNRIGGVMVTMLTSSAVGRGLEPRSIKPKTIKWVFVAFPQSYPLTVV